MSREQLIDRYNELYMNVPNDKMALSCYKKALEKLKDVDNEDFVRDYFRRKMYDRKD